MNSQYGYIIPGGLNFAMKLALSAGKLSVNSASFLIVQKLISLRQNCKIKNKKREY